jgi:hypothetical protein
MPYYTLFYVTQAKKYFGFKGPNLKPLGPNFMPYKGLNPPGYVMHQQV